LINVQFIFDNNYTDTIYFGIQRGITVVNDSTLISNNSFFIQNHFKLGVLNPPKGKIDNLKKRFSEGFRS